MENVSVEGVRSAAIESGIRYASRLDLVLFELAEKTKTAGVFTLNAFCAAPVMVARRHIAAMSPRYLLINTGNANAGTGVQGERDAIACCEAVARECGVNAEQVLPFSTGVIGELLPVDKIVGGVLETYPIKNISESKADIIAIIGFDQEIIDFKKPNCTNILHFMATLLDIARYNSINKKNLIDLIKTGKCIPITNPMNVLFNKFNHNDIVNGFNQGKDAAEQFYETYLK